ncbi:MAG: bifunctional glutamate N-acetyltransferase/amino-acid acetyltransferase ArgJ [Candidatus Angelobacter sp.]
MSTNPPQGFLFSACIAGIKASGKPDLALALVPDGASAAAMFTRNQIVAAPVTVGREHLRRGQGMIRALIVNAGNANCATGKQGLKAAASVCIGLAKHLKISPHRVFPSSTGIIGVPLPMEKIHAAIPGLVNSAAAGDDAFDQFANAILTTDTHKKVAAQSITYNQTQVVLAGVAKGAGMIHPNMATMLVYLFTDLSASPRELQTCLKEAADQSFNNISIDGDTSTNDTALLLASGKSGVQFKSVRNEFQAALTKVCRSLAGQIVADGEGVKHVVRLNIEQARSRNEARQIGRSIANSPLVKTAWAGADPNWGRILAAIGYSGVNINPERINIYLGEQQICRHGAACPFDHDRAHAYMSEPVYEIRIALGAGSAALEFLSCDLTAEYVRINADYST